MDAIGLDRDAAGHVYPVLLGGGMGTRLWPLSREASPKQLLALTSSRTLLQETARRARDALGLERPIVLCGADQRHQITEQLDEVGITPGAILCEPVGRSTAPALAAAALYLKAHDPQAVMLALPADHHIGDTAAFGEAARRAVRPATHGRLVCFGIRPTRAETGYGYIQRGAPLNDSDGAFAIARFIEKPDAATAARLAADDAYLWNSGMFVLPAAVFLEELGRYEPAALAACERALVAGQEKGGYVHLDSDAFAAGPSISVDYGVMERTDRAAVMPADMDWNDVGSWSNLRDAGERDATGNVIRGDVLTEDVRDSYIHSDGRLVAAIGVDNLVIVETGDAVLVSHAARAAEAGRIARHLKAAGRCEAETHRRVRRPWGYYESLDCGQRHQVKHIMVKPGARLSLQMHHHRAEHWIVVGGTGRIECDGESRLLSENERTYIPLGATHRLENPGKVPLHLIEVQVGDYLGEDDIVRFDDTYGRA